MGQVYNAGYNVSMLNYLIDLTVHHQYIVYAVLILLACAEGPVLSMIAGVLIKLNYLSFIPAYIALMVGDLIGDTIYFGIGHYFGHRFIKKFGNFFHIDEAAVQRMSVLFHRHKNSILFISKISNGLGLSILVLITAGIVRLPFWRYISVNLAGQFIWSGLLIAVGYFFSDWYLKVNSVFERIGIIVFFLAIVLLFLQYKKYLRSKIESIK